MVYHSQDISHDQQPGGANELTNSALEAPVEQVAPATPPSAATADADAPDTTLHADTNATVAIVAPDAAATPRHPIPRAAKRARDYYPGSDNRDSDSSDSSDGSVDLAAPTPPHLPVATDLLKLGADRR